METKKSLAYLKAKKKVETLKGLYGHLMVYVILNTIMILINANVFNGSPINFSSWSIYSIAIMWGIGLFFHILYVLVFFSFNTNRLKEWEDRKIQEIIREEEATEAQQFSKWQ